MSSTYVTVACPGVISTSVDGAVLCTDGAGTIVAWEQVVDFDPSQIDLTAAGSAFAVGFIMVGTAWAIGLGCKMVLKAIRSW